MTHIVLNSVNMLNFFPAKGGISDNISPKTIMPGETLDYKNHLRLQIEQYCQVHNEENPFNSQVPITKADIFLSTSINLQDRFNFIDLNTREKIFRRSPLPDTVISHVNTFGGNQPKQLTFTDRYGRLIGYV